MKIVHVIDSLAVGGAEMLLVNYVQYYKRVEPTSSHFLVLLKNEKTLLSKVEKILDGFEIVPFGKENALTAIKTFKKLVQAYKPDIVHTHLFYAMILARLGTSKKIPIVSTYHNQSYCKVSPYYSPWFGILDRLSFRHNHWRIFVSYAVQKCVENSTKSRLNGQLIGNFVDSNYYPCWKFNSTYNKLRLVAIGSLKKVKNHGLLINALALIPDLHVTLDIYGEGELRQDLQKNIDEKGVCINLKGNQALSSEILKDYDAFIMPSLSEGQPVSLLEAMTTGLPSLLSNIPSLKDLAGDAALYFSPTSPNELAAQIYQLVNKKEMLKLLSEAALEQAMPFSIHNYFNQTTKLYQAALSPRD